MKRILVACEGAVGQLSFEKPSIGFGNMKSTHIFAPVGSCSDLSVLTGGIGFFEPTGGSVAARELSGFCFMGGMNYAGIRQQKARTRGRSILAKCSPMERSTLQRRPILQELLSRPMSAVLHRDFRDGSNPVKQVREGAGDYLALLIQTETKACKQVTFKAVVKGIGNRCPKCGKGMERRVHSQEKSRKGKAYTFSEWDYCPSCRHVQHYEQFKCKSKQ